MTTALDVIEARLHDRWPDLAVSVAHGELTAYVDPDAIVDVLTFCRDDDALAFDYLLDVSGVHWPEQLHVLEAQLSTTGWPPYRITAGRGVIEVTYHLLSMPRNHRLRLVVPLPEEDLRVATATGIYPTAEFHEREVFDFFGVVFEGHPNLSRILNPDDWIGHPLRKDYPLGGVDTQYEGGNFIQPPDTRVWSRDVPGTDQGDPIWGAPPPTSPSDGGDT